MSPDPRLRANRNAVAMLKLLHGGARTGAELVRLGIWGPGRTADVLGRYGYEIHRESSTDVLGTTYRLVGKQEALL